VAGLALDVFEPQAEAFWRARVWREWLFASGQRPGRGLLSLYEEDFRDFTSTDLWADLQAATPEDPRQLRRLSALLASAYLEGRTRDYSISATRVEASAEVTFEDQPLPWREVPGRWPLVATVPRRHALEDAWRAVVRRDLTPGLERWQEAQRAELPTLTSQDWLPFWSSMREIDPEQPAQLAELILSTTAEVYGHGLSIYLGQLELPIDDVWQSDLAWAFRAPRFDTHFGEHTRMPLLVRAMRDLGIELIAQTDLHLVQGGVAGVQVFPLDIPHEVQVLQRLVGGWQDYGNSLFGLGMAQHALHTDPSLRFWERWLGDQTPTLGYGRLLQGLLYDRGWLSGRLEFAANDDFIVISRLAQLSRLRRIAGLVSFEQRLWQAEPGASMAAVYEEQVSAATRSRAFADDYLVALGGWPWSVLQATLELRAEVFASQLRAFLRREFDEEWWRSARAAHFIKDELWRPGRRHTAEELLGFMGYEGFAPALLSAEFEEVLRPL
jgi:hypothetical protein